MSDNSSFSQDHLRYDQRVQKALLGVVREILQEAARHWPVGEHHFYISFRSQAPGVKLSRRMVDKYPDEMTIVLQHQFWDLRVDEEAFQVGLSFNGIPETLHIPFAALVGFFDPSVQFGLKFATEDADNPAQAASLDEAPDNPEETSTLTRFTGRAKPERAGKAGKWAEAAQNGASALSKKADASKKAPKKADKDKTEGEGGNVNPAPAPSASPLHAQADSPAPAQVLDLEAFRKKKQP